MANKYWLALLKELAEEDRYCYECGEWHEDPPHHAFFHNRKGKHASDEIKKFVSDRRNLQDLCLKCHQSPGGYETNLKDFMAHQLSVYSYPSMKAWLDTCPTKMRNSHYDQIVLLLENCNEAAMLGG